MSCGLPASHSTRGNSSKLPVVSTTTSPAGRRRRELTVSANGELIAFDLEQVHVLHVEGHLNTPPRTKRRAWVDAADETARAQGQIDKELVSHQLGPVDIGLHQTPGAP